MVTQYPYPADEYLLIGKVIKAHGLNGDIKVKPFAESPAKFINYSRLALIAEDGRMTKLLNVEQCRHQGKFVILKLETIDTKAEADLLAEMGVLVSREELPELEADEYYLDDILEHDVRLVQSETLLGKINGFFNNGAQEIMVIHNGDDEFLVPLIDEIIVEIIDGVVIIDPPPGLLEMNLK
jgi:16S rRNA processing protein RimM